MRNLLFYILFVSSLLNTLLIAKSEEHSKQRNLSSSSDNQTLNSNNKSNKIIWKEVINEDNILRNNLRWEPVENTDEIYSIKKNIV